MLTESRLSVPKLTESKLSELVAEIKQKKELREISDKVVKEQLLKYFQQEPKAVNFVNNPRSDKFKLIIKSVRVKLRRSYGLFRQETLNYSDSVDKLLETHSSTKERLGFYPELYQRIFSTAMVPKTILDLGCGINPLSLKYMKLKEINYYAYDISEKEVAIINKFFQEEKKVHAKINGKAEIMDISKIEALKKLPPAEICFLFKITDILDNGKGHKVTEAVVQAVPAKYFIISFPTRTMSGKPMNAPRRKWMEWLCNRLKYKFTVLEFDNEIFYVVNKHG